LECRPSHVSYSEALIRQDILGRDENEDDPAGEDPDEEGLQKLQEIMNDLVIKQAPKRVQFSIPLKIGGKDGDIKIGISGYVSTVIPCIILTGRYALVSEQGKGQPKYVRMRGQTVEEVVTRSEYTSAVSEILYQLSWQLISRKPERSFETKRSGMLFNSATSRLSETSSSVIGGNPMNKSWRIRWLRMRCSSGTRREGDGETKVKRMRRCRSQLRPLDQQWKRPSQKSSPKHE